MVSLAGVPIQILPWLVGWLAGWVGDQQELLQVETLSLIFDCSDQQDLLE